MLNSHTKTKVYHYVSGNDRSQKHLRIASGLQFVSLIFAQMNADMSMTCQVYARKRKMSTTHSTQAILYAMPTIDGSS